LFKLKNRITFGALFLGIFICFLDVYLDYRYFYHKSFADLLVTEASSHELYIRLALIACFLGIGVFSARLITKLKQTEEELKVNMELFKNAQKIAHVGSWHLDIPRNILTWSDEVYRIFGLQPQEFGATYEEFLNRVHPDDRELVDTTYKMAIASHDPYELVHRIIRPDGEVRIVHEKSKDLTDESGKTIYSFGMVHDITEIKKSEAEKEKLIARLRKSLSEIKTLRGILPICSYCKKIRDDKGYWDQVEVYLKQHTDADFSHGICPECLDKYFPELNRGGKE
jgi:PAS domain S-box-containing protein